MKTALIIVAGLASILLVCWSKIKQFQKRYTERKIYELDEELDDIGVLLLRMDEDYPMVHRGVGWQMEHDKLFDRQEWCITERKKLVSWLQKYSARA